MNDFHQAVVTHQQWRVAFERAIRARGDGFDPEIVRRDDLCTLGQWLHGAGRAAMNNLTAHAMLTDVHAEFHLAAARVLEMARAERLADAAQGMDPGSQYSRWSATLLAALQRYGDGEKDSSG